MASIAFAAPSPALTPAQEQVIALIAAGFSIRKIADEVKIHRNTIGNWRRTNPAFAQALADAQYDRVLYWRDQAEEHAALAIQTLGEILNDRKAPASVRLRAALAVLKHATTLPPGPGPADNLVADPSLVQPDKPLKVHNVAQRPAPAPPAPPAKPHKRPKLAQPQRGQPAKRPKVTPFSP